MATPKTGSARRSAAGVGKPSIKTFNIERAAYRFPHHALVRSPLRALPRAAHRVGGRHGAPEFLADLFNKLRSTVYKMPGYFHEDPVASFREHV